MLVSDANHRLSNRPLVFQKDNTRKKYFLEYVAIHCSYLPIEHYEKKGIFF